MPVCLFCSTQEAESFLGFGYRKKKRPHSQAFLQCGFFIFPNKTFSLVKNFLAHPGACGILVSNQDSNLYPLHWNHGVLTTGLPGKSPKLFPF